MDWLGWIPDLAVLDVWVWVVAFVPVVVIGIPVILATVRVPRKLGLVEVADPELTDNQRRWFEGLGERLRSAGYVPAVTFRAEHLPNKNLSRAYVSGMDGSAVTAMSLRDEREGVVLSDNLVEFTSEFADGSFVSTRSTTVTDLFDLLPRHERHIHHTRDVADLQRRHARYCAPHHAAGAVPFRVDSMFERMREFHTRWLAHQEARGLIRERDAESYAPTLRLALRGVGSFFNPFGDRFSLVRFVLSLAAGLAVPVLGAWALAGPSAPLLAQVEATLPGSPDLALLVALAPAFLLGAAAVGWILESRAVVWAPLLASLAGWCALPASTPDEHARLAWLGVLVGTSIAAHWLSNLRHRRQALV